MIMVVVSCFVMQTDIFFIFFSFLNIQQRSTDALIRRNTQKQRTVAVITTVDRQDGLPITALPASIERTTTTIQHNDEEDDELGGEECGDVVLLFPRSSITVFHFCCRMPSNPLVSEKD